MSAERTEQALARIETALARIELAGRKAATTVTEQARRHEHLRTAVGETLRDLDLIIADHGA